MLLSHRDLAGVHFTGSTEVFNDMWRTIGASMSTYRSYPRIVGETGGKDFNHRALRRPTWTRWAVAIVRRRLRIPGTEVLGGEPRLHPEVDLERPRATAWSR